MAKWKDLFIAGLGGGAAHAVADQFLGQMLPGNAIAGTGMALKDVALILLGKYGAGKTKGMMSQALEGMAVIGIYKVVYPQFIEPLIGGIVPKSNPGHNPGNPVPKPMTRYPTAPF